MTNHASATRPTTAGFTVLELVIVLVILGILAAVASASLPSGLFGSGPDLQRAEDQLAGALREARTRALGCGGGERRVTLNTGEDPWLLVAECSNGDDQEKTFQRLPNGITVTSHEFVFRYPFGNLLDEDGMVPVTLSGGGESRIMCVHGLTGNFQRGNCQ